MPLAPINHILTAKSNNRIVHKRYVYETFPLRWLITLIFIGSNVV
jgi:hypothetical protein